MADLVWILPTSLGGKKRSMGCNMMCWNWMCIYLYNSYNSYIWYDNSLDIRRMDMDALGCHTEFMSFFLRKNNGFKSNIFSSWKVGDGSLMGSLYPVVVFDHFPGDPNEKLGILPRIFSSIWNAYRKMSPWILDESSNQSWWGMTTRDIGWF